MEKENKPIVINLKLKVTKNPHGIPLNSNIDIRIEIIDEYEFIRTSNYMFTMDLVTIEKSKPTAPGTIAKYSPRLQKAIIKFPGMKKEAIAKLVAEDLKKIQGA